jgi:Thrombospondin type 3 repeat
LLRALGVAAAATVAVGFAAGERNANGAPPSTSSPSTKLGTSDDWTMHTAIGLDLGVGSTISSYNQDSGPSATLFYTALRGTYDLPHGFAALLTLRQWWLPSANHATMLGVGARYEPFVYPWGRIFFDAALGPTSTSFAWAFGYDLGAGMELELPDAPGFSMGPYLRYGSVVNPDRRDSDDGRAWNIGGSFTYHFGRAAAGAKSEPEHHGPASDSYRISIPDTDRDGIADDEDQCRDVPAGPHPDPFRPGCPEADEDGDGIPDVEDACPVTPPGPKPDPKRPGCPFIDSDGDGITDADDACPTRPGPASPEPSKNGCPDPRKPPVVVAPPPPSAKDESIAPKPVRKHHIARPPEGQ